MAAMNAASFALDGLLKPLIFLTNCNEAARTSSGVTGGSKLKSVLIFLHMDIGYREQGDREQQISRRSLGITKAWFFRLGRDRDKLKMLLAGSQLLASANGEIKMFAQEFGGFFALAGTGIGSGV